MKRLVSLVGGCLLYVCVFAQTAALEITTDKTTSLVFPFPVTHVDRGTKEVLVQQIKEAGNILLIKAASGHFSETNLSVVTGDGSIYSFMVNYKEQPGKLIYYLPEKNKTSIATFANGLLNNHRTMKGIQDKKWNMQVTVTGIYIKENVIYYQLLLCNGSPIDYDIDLMRFYRMVVAMQKFTIPDAQYFAIQLMEKNGGRHLDLRVNNNKIIRAIPLAGLK